jgi:O-antigen/teichoic acid export membrane protein
MFTPEGIRYLETHIFSRFVFSFAANLLKSATALASNLIIARELAPEHYGEYAYLLVSFLSLKTLIDMGSSNAFYTFISKKERNKQFFTRYSYWLLVQLTLPIIIIILIPNTVKLKIWVTSDYSLILFAFIASYMQQTIWNFIVSLGEAYRRTKSVQKLNICLAVVHLSLIIIFAYFEMLTIKVIYLLISIEFSLSLLYVYLFWPKNLNIRKSTEENKSFKHFLKEFWLFCGPLIPLLLVSSIYIFVERWLLQKYGGSTQQAFFAVGMQLSAITLIATTTVLKILWKEVAEAYEHGEYQRVELIYNKVTKWLFVLASAFSGYLIPWSNEFLNLLLGENYANGGGIFSVLLLYPIHQTLGQITTSMFYAQEKTKIYTKISIFFVIVNLVLSYIVLAPSSNFIPGMELKGAGLAVKLVLMQMVTVNVVIYTLHRINGWKYNLSHQVITLLSAIFIGFFAKYLVTSLLELPIISELILSGIIFSILFVLLIYAKSEFFIMQSNRMLKYRINIVINKLIHKGNN